MLPTQLATSVPNLESNTFSLPRQAVLLYKWAIATVTIFLDTKG
jgi:hypothetical protein